MSEEISEERKAAYYIGMLLTAGGALAFGINLFANATAKNPFNNDHQSMATWALGSMAVCVVGGILMGIGKAGAAGSGLVLDPKKAREDLEPYSRMAGGMVKDALEESCLKGSARSSQRAEEVIKIRCRSCSALNEEDAKFCKECGNPL